MARGLLGRLHMNALLLWAVVGAFEAAPSFSSKHSPPGEATIRRPIAPAVPVPSEGPGDPTDGKETNRSFELDDGRVFIGNVVYRDADVVLVQTADGASAYLPVGKIIREGPATHSSDSSPLPPNQPRNVLSTAPVLWIMAMANLEYERLMSTKLSLYMSAMGSSLLRAYGGQAGIRYYLGERGLDGGFVDFHGGLMAFAWDGFSDYRSNSVGAAVGGSRLLKDNFLVSLGFGLDARHIESRETTYDITASCAPLICLPVVESETSYQQSSVISVHVRANVGYVF